MDMGWWQRNAGGSITYINGHSNIIREICLKERKSVINAISALAVILRIWSQAPALKMFMMQLLETPQHLIGFLLIKILRISAQTSVMKAIQI